MSMIALPTIGDSSGGSSTTAATGSKAYDFWGGLSDTLGRGFVDIAGAFTGSLAEGMRAQNVDAVAPAEQPAAPSAATSWATKPLVVAGVIAACVAAVAIVWRATD